MRGLALSYTHGVDDFCSARIVKYAWDSSTGALSV